jgi:hypothetical protein
MTHLSDSAFVPVDIVAWQRELGKTAFHIGTADRDYSIGTVYRAVDPSEEKIRQRIASYIDLPTLDRLEAPPARDGPTQVYVLGMVELSIPEGEVLTSDFSDAQRRYTFIGKENENTMDVAPFETL